jgi:tetratricopeptide (TPR) repeat protein
MASAAWGARVEGVIADASGSPAAGLQVELRPQDKSMVTLRTKTKKKGSFLFGIVADGVYQISVSDSRITSIEFRAVDDEGKTLREFDETVPPDGASPPIDVSKAEVVTVNLTLGPSSVEAAAPDLERALPSSAELTRMIESGELEPARTKIDEGLAENPDDARLLYLSAYLDMKTDRLEPALASIERAAASAEPFPGVQLLRGVILQQLGRDDEALAAFRRETAAAEPRVVRDAWIRIVELARKLDRSAELEEGLRAIIALEPDDVTAWSQLLELEIRNGDTAAVEEVLRSAPETLRQDPRTHFNVGVQHWNRGEAAPAAAAFARAIELDPGMADAHKQLGLAEGTLGNHERAIAALRRYLELAPAATDAEMMRQYLAQLEAEAAPR